MHNPREAMWSTSKRHDRLWVCPLKCKKKHIKCFDVDVPKKWTMEKNVSFYLKGHHPKLRCSHPRSVKDYRWSVRLQWHGKKEKHTNGLFNFFGRVTLTKNIHPIVRAITSNTENSQQTASRPLTERGMQVWACLTLIQASKGLNNVDAWSLPIHW